MSGIIRSVLADNRVFLEGLRWRDGRFWASDVHAGAVISVSPADGVVTEVAKHDGLLSGLGWLPDGDLLVVSMLEDKLLRLRNGAFVTQADLAHVTRGRPNDMHVDAQGRAYIGATGFDVAAGGPIAAGALILVEPDGQARVVAEDLWGPNGITAIEGGRTLVVAETFSQRLTAFSVDRDGGLSDRRVWAEFGPPPQTLNFGERLSSLALAPDGIAGDGEDHIWVADPMGRRVVRVRAGGEILAALTVDGGDGVYACALGGADGKTLAVCTAPTHDPSILLAARPSRLMTAPL